MKEIYGQKKWSNFLNKSIPIINYSKKLLTFLENYDIINSNAKTIIEIPVTIMLVFKLLFHLNYLNYLDKFSMVLMQLYLKTPIGMCKITKTSISFLLPLLDLIGCDHITELTFFHRMNRSNKKVEIFKDFIRLLQKNEVVNISRYLNFPI